MINISTIYKITNPSGKVYIGQTTNFEKRMSYYRLGRAKRQKKIHNSIQKYGWESHTVEMLYAGPLTEEGLNQLEIHYIRIYNSFKEGLNLTEGGEKPPSQKGKRQSQERILKKFKPIQQLTKEGIWIRDWNSQKRAAEALGIDRGNISTCLKGRQKTAGGFVWKYSEE
jgi:group I intron endonuclease